jgi:hypothetical protein
MKEIFISSQGKANPSNFEINLPYCSEIKLVEASIPGSFSNIATSQIIIMGSASGMTVIPIAGGRYTMDNFATYLTGQITSFVGGQVYTVATGPANNFIFSSSTENFSITGDTAAAYVGFTTTGTAASHTGKSVYSGFYSSHMFIKMDKIFGVDNGTVYEGETGILHAVPLCSANTNYRADSDAPWVKLINIFNVLAPTISITVSLKLANGGLVDMNGDNWAMKLYVKL